MINTVSDLLKALLERERQALQRYKNLGHGPMIGDMYEGLSRKALDLVLFEGLDLRVVDGKIEFDDGRLSGQKDALIVIGDGKQIPHTEHFIYPMASVLAVIEVKKTLYGDELERAYAGLSDLRHGADDVPMHLGRANRAFRTIVQREAPLSCAASTGLTFELEMLFGVCLQEASMPVRIVLGYEGYQTERGLREGFLKYLEDVVREGPKQGYGPVSFPTLIMNSRAGLVKLNAMPYAINYDGPAGGWLCYASVGTKDVHRVLLEVLWTRLASQFDISPAIFGDDLEGETLWPLLFTTPVEFDDKLGWGYRDATMEFPNKPAAEVASWQPVVFTESEIAGMLHHLLEAGSVDTSSDEVYLKFAENLGKRSEEIVEDLRVAGIAAVDGAGVWNLLTEQCQMVVLPWGVFAVGENGSGRLSRWTDAQLAKRKDGS